MCKLKLYDSKIQKHNLKVNVYYKILLPRNYKNILYLSKKITLSQILDK